MPIINNFKFKSCTCIWMTSIKKIIISHVLIVHVVMTYGHSALGTQSRIWAFILLTRLWPVLRRDNFSVYVICASRIIFNNLYEIYQWYLDNASHSESQSLLITRATALY